MDKSLPVVLNIFDVEDAILLGQEEFNQIMQAVSATFLMPMIEQQIAQALVSMPSDQGFDMAQSDPQVNRVMQQMMNGGNNGNPT